MSFTVGMLAPITVAEFRENLHPHAWRDDLPKGLGGTPVNLLCRELLARGQRLVIFTLDPSVAGEVRLEGHGLRICIGPFRRRRARDFFALERAFLEEAIRRERPDVLHAQWTYEYALAAQASGLPHVITAHDAPLNVLRRNFIPYRIARTLMAYRVISRARRIVSVSPYVAEHLARFMLYRGARQVIPNGLPDSLFAHRIAPPSSTGDIVYATVLSGWGELKNGRTAIEAFARVRKARPDDRLVMFGAGHGKDEPAAEWARDRGIAEGIEFAGSVPHGELLRALAERVDVLVHPSLEEAQPMSIAEALAVGVPVIAGRRSGGVPWTVDEGRAGLLVDVSSARSVADAMVQLATSASLRSELSLRGREHAARSFHVRTIADAYQRTYGEMLER